MAALLGLSHELLHCIFTEIEPADLGALSQSCHTLNRYIRGNRLLHRDLYLRRYDRPPRVERSDEPNWEGTIQQLVKLEKLLVSEHRDVKRSNLAYVAEQINVLMGTASSSREDSKNLKLLSTVFQDPDNIDTFLCASSLFARAGNENQQEAETEELRQASAKLHCLYGVPIDMIPTRSLRSRLLSDPLGPACNTRSHIAHLAPHRYARSKVYDLREYTDLTLWGPFRNDGSHRVDWEKVEAVMIVLGYNLRKFTERSEGRFPLVWNDTFAGASPGSYKSAPRLAVSAPKELDKDMYKIRELALSLDAMDPYGVSGTWMRVVCFLDYNDLYAFNFIDRIPDDQQRDPIDIEEGSIDLEETLQVTRVEPPGSGDDDEPDDGLDWSNFKGERLPVVHFRGTSRSMHASWDPNANSRIRGTVRQTPEGEIRWTTFSIFHGEERWRSEGIQVGGQKSARGVLGNWFDKDFDMHGPAGPTAFWKETDDLEEEKTSSTPLAYI